jgi:hypothetical protein
LSALEGQVSTRMPDEVKKTCYPAIRSLDRQLTPVRRAAKSAHEMSKP